MFGSAILALAAARSAGAYVLRQWSFPNRRGDVTTTTIENELVESSAIMAGHQDKD